MKILFFLGKGGVGKSTLSAVVSLILARQKKDVHLASLDPAHNLSDIFEKKFSDNPQKVISGLNAQEINQEKWLKRYLKQSSQDASKAYSYLSTFSMDEHFSVMRYAPGIEEYALLLAFGDVIKNNKNKDFCIFDMPPTALTLKFFSLPKLSLIWLEKLKDIRDQILEKEKIIHKLNLGKTELERDRVLENLQKQIHFWTDIKNLFGNVNKVQPIIITNPDRLAESETSNIIRAMKDLQIVKPLIFLNKADKNNNLTFDYVFSKGDKLIGLNALENYLNTTNVTDLVELF
jgi:arsenite-transporting ATPase